MNTADARGGLLRELFCAAQRASRILYTQTASGFWLGCAIAMSLATQLRFNSWIGPGDLLILIWILSSLAHLRLASLTYTHKDRMKLLAAAAAMVFLFAAFGWGATAYLSDNLLPSPIRDLVACLYALSINALVFMRAEEELFIDELVYGVLFSSVFAFALVTPELQVPNSWHRSWWAPSRYMGWAGNPNQTALIFVGLPFVAWHLASQEQSPFRRMRFIGLGLGALILGLLANSDGHHVGTALGVLACYFSFCFGHFAAVAEKRDVHRGFWSSRFAFDLLFVMPFALLFLKFQKLVNIATAIYHGGGEKGAVRFRLWANGLEAVTQSPIFGFGVAGISGVDRPFVGSEAHNSFIDFLGFGGPLALLAQLTVTFLALRKTFTARAWLLVGGVCALSAYSLFGCYFRHPFYWLMLQIFYWLAVEKEISSQTFNRSNTKAGSERNMKSIILQNPGR